MKVFKFGGASVQDVPSIQNVANIIEGYISSDQLVVVISALGKTTNMLENVALAAFRQENNAQTLWNNVIQNHIDIASKLGLKHPSEGIAEISNKINSFLQSIESDNYNYIYDQIVSQGEVLSTTLITEYLQWRSIDAQLISARLLIKTDSNYTDANINWVRTQESVDKELKPLRHAVMVTQGFIGSNPEMMYTTLGREGSDYTAAILSHCLHTTQMTIWKDVDGVYTADPKKFPEATIIPRMSYKEAIEMTFYGAQIIHPKTIKPIQNSNCVLQVKSFKDKTAPGTEIGNFTDIVYQPVIVLKENQVLYTFSIKDFSFLNENNLGKIIATFGQYSLRINLMQNTAIEFYVLTDEKLGKNEQILQDLSEQFHIHIDTHLQLLTVRHYNDAILEHNRTRSNVILVQKNDTTIQYLIRE